MPPRLLVDTLVLAFLLAAAGVSAAAPPAGKTVVHQEPHHEPPQLPPPHHVEQLQKSPITTDAFFERCDALGSLDWVKYNGACYRWFETPDYWEPALRKCEALRGSLTSITNSGENGFVGKLTYCQEAWIGRYAVNVDRMMQADNYRFTDGSSKQFHAHNNFTNAQLHYPLISTKDLFWRNNVYHQKHTYVCKVPSQDRNYTCNCPTGWKELSGYCYRMPAFTATYIEGDYYCRGHDAHLTSVHSDTELRAMSLIDVETNGCPDETWIGLVKLNPCRPEYGSGGNIKETCYRWSDRSGNYNGIPKWTKPNEPNNDLVTNCVILKDREIRNVPCHTRARFVCKKKVGK